METRIPIPSTGHTTILGGIRDVESAFSRLTLQSLPNAPLLLNGTQMTESGYLARAHLRPTWSSTDVRTISTPLSAEEREKAYQDFRKPLRVFLEQLDKRIPQIRSPEFQKLVSTLHSTGEEYELYLARSPKEARTTEQRFWDLVAEVKQRVKPAEDLSANMGPE